MCQAGHPETDSFSFSICKNENGKRKADISCKVTWKEISDNGTWSKIKQKAIKK